jgi:hypothetical protein
MIWYILKFTLHVPAPWCRLTVAYPVLALKGWDLT